MSTNEAAETGAGPEQRRRGPRGPRGDIAALIVNAARQRFATDGYDGTAMTTIAADVNVDAKLVRYYFEDKEALLEATLIVPEEFSRAAREAIVSPVQNRGEAIVANLLRSWKDPELRLTLRSILVMAGNEPIAMARVRSYFQDSLIAAVEATLPADERGLRAGLVSGQLIGIAFSRFVFELEQATAPDDQTVIRIVGATVQRYLDGDLGDLGD